MEGRAFDEQWSSLPLALRAQIFFLVPVYVIYLFLFGTRETIAKNIAVEDLPSSNEVLLQDDDFDKLDALLLDERDRRLIRNIASLNEANGKDKKTVGVVFGAMHMRNVTSFLLHKLKYRIAKAEWVTVFDL
jgi:pheromone shutdown protein TraB